MRRFFARKPVPTAADLAAAKREAEALRQLAFGVLYSCQRAGFGRAPSPTSPWPALASLGGWVLAVLVILLLAFLAAHK